MNKLFRASLVGILLALPVSTVGDQATDERFELRYPTGIQIYTVVKLYEGFTGRQVEVGKNVSTNLMVRISTGVVTKSEAVKAIELALLKQHRLELKKVDETKSLLHVAPNDVRRPPES